MFHPPATAGTHCPPERNSVSPAQFERFGLGGFFFHGLTVNPSKKPVITRSVDVRASSAFDCSAAAQPMPGQSARAMAFLAPRKNGITISGKADAVKRSVNARAAI
jgi:hypothetical protein